MSAGFHIIIGNHMEVLAEGLAGIIRTGKPNNPIHTLSPDIILVQSKGMQRWVSMVLARHNGICANTHFPFPNAFLESIYTRISGCLTKPASSPTDPPADCPSDLYNPVTMTFCIMRLLPDLLVQDAFQPLRDYLRYEPYPLKLYQLSHKIADVFDQYLVFRPDMILQWERQELDAETTDQWQAMLWQQITREMKSNHRANQQKELVQQFVQAKVDAEVLPHRLFVFGISHLPPFHLDVLAAIAQCVPVFLFLLNPCQVYWADILSDRQMMHVRTKQGTKTLCKDDLHLHRGNSLLASWGQLGKSFFNLLHQFPNAQITEFFTDNHTDTILGRIQQDILELQDPIQLSENAYQHKTFAKPDPSISIHACHSPMREIEILFDQLLQMFESNPSLQPRDILVMAPDMAAYAPYVRAVFSVDDNRKIPFSVADQAIQQESSIVDGFLTILELTTSRLEVSRVLALLEYPAVRARFGIEETDLSMITSWIQSVQICWGWDGTYRKKHNLPGFSENTWRNGLDRLLLGFAMAGEQDTIFAGIAPFNGVEGSQAKLLGKLVDFCEALNESLVQLNTTKSVKNWQRVLHALLNRFFMVNEPSARDYQTLREIIDQLALHAQTGGYTQPLGFAVIHQYLIDALARTSFDLGFIAGGVTFCSMLPMRSIPAKVICLIGMNHDAFPREQREPGFNLIASYPRPGDRDKRNDDKYLFLEALISARQKLYISFVGRDIRDNAVIPPSVLVSELLEYLGQCFGIDSERLIIHHPLHPFSAQYYDGQTASLFTYSKENLVAARSLIEPHRSPAFFVTPLKPPPESWRQCDLGQLRAFFNHPIRFVLEHRLGLFLREKEEMNNDREKFSLDGLDRFVIGQRMLKAELDGAIAPTFTIMRAKGDLPHGTAGKVFDQALRDNVNLFRARLSDQISDQHLCDLEVDLKIGAFQIRGTISGVGQTTRIYYRLAKMRPQDLVIVFLEHLMMMAEEQAGIPKVSLFLCQDSLWRFEPVKDFARTLEAYLSIYWQGLQQPLPFFAHSSYTYAWQRLNKNQSAEAALQAARQKWVGNANKIGESQDPYVIRCFEDQNPFTKQFEICAMEIFEPLLALCQKLKEA